LDEIGQVCAGVQVVGDTAAKDKSPLYILTSSQTGEL